MCPSLRTGVIPRASEPVLVSRSGKSALEGSPSFGDSTLIKARTQMVAGELSLDIMRLGNGGRERERERHGETVVGWLSEMTMVP